MGPVPAVGAATVDEPAFIINNPFSMEYLNQKAIIASIVYSLIGILILVIAFVVIEKLAPQQLWRKIVDEQNVALAIMAAGFMLAVAIIVGLASHG